MPDDRIVIPPGLRPYTIVQGKPVYKLRGRFWTADGYPYRPGMYFPRSLLDEPPRPQPSPSLLDSVLADSPGTDRVGAMPAAMPAGPPTASASVPSGAPTRPAATWATGGDATPGGPLPPRSPIVNGPPADLADRVLQAESAGNPNAVSPVGAQGLMQIMPATGRELAGQIGEDYRPFDPQQNVRLGKRYLAQMLNKYGGNPAHALAAYNWGPGNVDRWLKRGGDPGELPQETQRYIAKVMGGETPTPSKRAAPTLPSNAWQIARAALIDDPVWGPQIKAQATDNSSPPTIHPQTWNAARMAIRAGAEGESDRLNLAQVR